VSGEYELAAGAPAEGEQSEAERLYPAERFDGSIAETLVGARELIARYRAGPDTCPAGCALIRAAVDMRRQGITRPVTETELRQLSPLYLPVVRTGLRPTPDAFGDGIAWAARERTWSNLVGGRHPSAGRRAARLRHRPGPGTRLQPRRGYPGHRRSGQDGIIRLWDVTSREQIGVALAAAGHSTVAGIAFNPDGSLLASAASSGIQIWGLALEKNTLNRVCAIAGGPMTRQDWDFYVRSEPYRQVCP
jgi:hypothetical protein